MVVAIRLPAEFEDELEELAKKMRRTKSYVIREAIVGYLIDSREVSDSAKSKEVDSNSN